MTSISKQINAFYLLLIILGGTLSTLVYFSGNAISSTTTTLVDVDLPLLDNVSKLRFAIFAQKPILYEYYANTNRDIFTKKFSESKNSIKTGLYILPRDEQGQAFLTQIEFLTGQITQQAEQLDQILRSSEIDWDKARDILADVSATEIKITPLIDNFVALNKKHVTDIGALAKSRMQTIILMVIGFTLFIFISAFFLGRNVNARVTQE